MPTKNTSAVVTRFPPSPTGRFHVGSVRTALYNYLYAKKYGGLFILRIEDTDRERSTKEYEDDIVESLKWLGLEYTGFSRQSERSAVYKKYLQGMVDSGKAYISKEAPKKEGDRAEVIRFKNPNTKISFQDEIRGLIEFDTTDLGDFVIAKSLDEPLYHLAVVVDDFESGVTHVIRGEDHISNTPRQILIQEAIGAPRPVYAHLPLILDETRAKLSKRKHGEKVSLKHYIDEGFLRDAIINYMALLGWNPGGERELYSLSEMPGLFDLSKVQKAGAVFNEEKLRWFNKEYIRMLAKETIQAELEKIFGGKISGDMLKKITPVVLERASTFGDVANMLADGELDYIFNAPSFASPEIAAKINWKSASSEKTKAHLEKIAALISALPESAFGADSIKTAEEVKAAVWPYAEAAGRGEVLWPLRYTLSGREKSPDPFTLVALLGKDETVSRISAAISALSVVS
jgi:glutamyl-tRNA synthetase